MKQSFVSLQLRDILSSGRSLSTNSGHDDGLQDWEGKILAKCLKNADFNRSNNYQQNNFILSSLDVLKS